MGAFLRRWVALEGHAPALHQELRLVHETYARKSAAVRESLMYREHFLGSEFIGLVVCDDDAGLGTEQGQAGLARLDDVTAAHAKVKTPWLRLEMVDEFMGSPQASPYGAAGLLSCPPAFAREFATRLTGLAAELAERLHPTRLLVAEAVDRPGLFVILGDSNYPVDLDRYLRSSLHHQHRAALGSLLTAPARWYLLDPVWRYFRAGPPRAQEDEARRNS